MFISQIVVENLISLYQVWKGGLGANKLKSSILQNSNSFPQHKQIIKTILQISFLQKGTLLVKSSELNKTLNEGSKNNTSLKNSLLLKDIKVNVST